MQIFFKYDLFFLYNIYTLVIQQVEDIIMLMKRRVRVSTFTAFAAALLLLVTDAYAGCPGETPSDNVDTVMLPLSGDPCTGTHF